MRVRLTFDVDEEQRLAIAALRGRRRPANRTQVIQEISGLVGGFIRLAVDTQRQKAAAAARKADELERRQLKMFEETPVTTAETV